MGSLPTFVATFPFNLIEAHIFTPGLLFKRIGLDFPFEIAPEDLASSSGLHVL